MADLHERSNRLTVLPRNAVRPAACIMKLETGIETESLVKRGEQIPHRAGLVRHLRAILAGCPIHLATFNSAPTDDDRPAARPVIAAGILVDPRRAAEF